MMFSCPGQCLGSGLVYAAISKKGTRTTDVQVLQTFLPFLPLCCRCTSRDLVIHNPSISELSLVCFFGSFFFVVVVVVRGLHLLYREAILISVVVRIRFKELKRWLADCTSRGSGFTSQHPHGHSQLSMNSSSGGSNTLTKTSKNEE